jgi:hypothetical protein
MKCYVAVCNVKMNISNTAIHGVLSENIHHIKKSQEVTGTNMMKVLGPQQTSPISF